jgi:quinoprotein glucose dehydrogenase
MNTTVATVISGALLILIGGTLFAGGAYLVSLAGSPYYLIAGASVLIAGVLYCKGSRWGERLYAVMLAGTSAWSCVESGDNPWALTARLFAPAVLGVWLAMPWVRLGLREIASPAPWRSEIAVVAIVIFALIAERFVQFENAAKVTTPPTAVAEPQEPIASNTDWPSYGNGLHGQRFAPLAQINTQNVSKLQVAWIHHSGLIDKAHAEATPIKIGDTLYTCNTRTEVFAIDAKTGKEKWRNAPKADGSQIMVATCRGVAFYQVPDATGPCAARVIATGPGPLLRAMDAETGEACANFGVNGRVDLTTGLGRVAPGEYTLNSAPTVARGLIILGAYVADHYEADIASGVIRAFDAQTGELRWAWDMGAPDRIGLPPEGETYTRSTPNAWPAFAADEALGLVYVPTGNPSPDFLGTARRPFDEKYGSAILALNLTDGRLRWSYQTTHHDLWDFDVQAQPLLITLPGADGDRPALLQATKRGDIFVLDRRDGSLIMPAPEVEVPQGGMPGEPLSKTQPVSQINFFPPLMTEASMWGATPIDQMMCRIAFRRADYRGPFTPPSLQKTLMYPAPAGGFVWSGLSVDDDNKIAIASPNDIVMYTQLVPREKVANADDVPWPQRGTPYIADFSMFFGPLAIPCKQPPWGTLAAIDLKTGGVLWRHVIGTTQDSGPWGLPTGLPLLIGTSSFGGTLTTRGNLIFMAATLDHYFRAYDSKTGRKLWEYRLPVGAHATPMTYVADGKQYIVLTVGGHATFDTKFSDQTIAFALPDK